MDDIQKDLVAAVPALRAFAISLTGDRDRADDLVQETLVRALAATDRFQPGTNLNAWLFTILRNQFYSTHRKRRREVEDPDGEFVASLATPAPQPWRLEWTDFLKAFAQLAPQQRQFVDEEAAATVVQEEVDRDELKRSIVNLRIPPPIIPTHGAQLMLETFGDCLVEALEPGSVPGKIFGEASGRVLGHEIMLPRGHSIREAAIRSRREIDRRSSNCVVWTRGPDGLKRLLNMLMCEA